MAVYKLLGIKRVDLGYKSSHNTASAIADGTATSVTLPSAADALFVETVPSITRPYKAFIESEVVYITAYNPTTHVATIVRAGDGTSGVAHASGTAMHIRALVWFSFSNAFNINANINNLTFQGDGTQEIVPLSNGITGTISASKFATDFLDKIAGSTKLSGSGLPADESARWFRETGTYPYVEALCKLKGINDSGDGGDIELRLDVFKVKVQKPWTPANAGNNAVMGTEMAWTSIETKTGILGETLPGSIGDGVHFAMAVLA